MAHRTFPLYNISASVGQGGVNRNDDVRLIQSMISIALTPAVDMKLVAQRCVTYKLATPKGPVAVSGSYNEDLGNWIKLLQTHTQRFLGVNCACDGRIDPIPVERNTLDYSSVSKTGKQYYLMILIRSAIHKDAKGYVALADHLSLPFELDGSSMPLNL